MSFSSMYKPENFSDLVFQNALTARIAKQYAECKRSGHLILSGPHGTGKSTIARIIHKERQVLQGVSVFPFIINGSSLNKSQEPAMLGALNMWLSAGEKMPCWIVEEADCIPPSYKAGFQQFLDDWKHLAFVIMTTNHLTKIPTGLRSRGQICDVQCMPRGFWLAQLQRYLVSKNVNVTNAKLLSMLNKTGNSIRDVEKLADTLAP